MSLEGRHTKLALLAFLAFGGLAFFVPPPVVEPEPPVTISSQQETVGLRLFTVATAGIPSSRSLASADSLFTYSSPVLDAPHTFNAVGFDWAGSLPLGADLIIEARSSQDGKAWSEWYAAGDLDALQGHGATSTDLLFLQGRFLQYRLTVMGASSAWNGDLESVKVTYIDSTQGPTADQASQGGPLIRRLAALVRPNVMGRSAWGANEVYRFDQGKELSPVIYAPVQKIIIHHTASTNAPPDPAASVRAIYYFHAVKQGWGDIGYNYIIDPNGRVYEGRYGGPGVVGMHALNYNTGSIGIALLGNFDQASPSGPALNALESLILAKSVQHGIDPSGRGFYVDKDLPNVVGHSDVVGTTCPGDFMYSLLEGQRALASANLPLLGQAWIKDTTPKIIVPGSSDSRYLDAPQQRYFASWASTGTNPIRVGFRWYRANGALYQDGTNSTYLTPLTKAIAPQEDAVVQVTLQAPNAAGHYLLKWDLFQEGIGWFEEQGKSFFGAQSFCD